jgi:excisionase family DNA binding protein
VTSAVYYTIKQAGDAYPALGARLLRRWVERREIAFHRTSGNRILLRADDIERKLAENRVEPMRSLRNRRVAS